MRFRPFAVLACVCVAACGDPLADDAFRGDPLITLRGTIRANEVLTIEEGSVRVSVFWVLDGTDAPNIDVARLVEQRSASAEARFPALVTINVFSRPDASVLVEPHRRFAIGRLFAYHDVEDNGVFDGDDYLLGEVANRALIFNPTDLSADEAPTLLPLEAGFHLTYAPLYCADPPFERVGNGCEVPVGDPCDSDADCGEGLCLDDEVGSPWQEGMCVGYSCRPGAPPSANDPRACDPGGTRAFLRGEANYLLPPCAQPSDCPREGYSCDPGLGACVGETPMTLVLRTDAAPTYFCALAPPTGGGGMPPPRPPPMVMPMPGSVCAQN